MSNTDGYVIVEIFRLNGSVPIYTVLAISPKTTIADIKLNDMAFKSVLPSTSGEKVPVEDVIFDEVSSESSSSSSSIDSSSSSSSEMYSENSNSSSSFSSSSSSERYSSSSSLSSSSSSSSEGYSSSSSSSSLDDVKGIGNMTIGSTFVIG